jgi:TPR repeat protein
MYSSGQGVPKDLAKALQWNLKAAASGSIMAENNLGFIYEHGGLSGKPDLTEALKWYRKAAEQGLPQAEYNLGLLYRDGRGVAKDLEASRRLLAQAAAHGYEPKFGAAEDSPNLP